MNKSVFIGGLLIAVIFFYGFGRPGRHLSTAHIGKGALLPKTTGIVAAPRFTTETYNKKRYDRRIVAQQQAAQPTKVSKVSPLSRRIEPKGLSPAASLITSSVQPNTLALGYAPEDSELIRHLASQAQRQGSRVAYIGEVPELYAFDPRFFVKNVDAQGQPSLQAHEVESVEGDKLVQREPYPIPSSSSLDYNLLNFAVRRATDDGAMLINLASANVDRLRLADSINYARNHGAVVVTVRPPGMK
jgi:hypothetical protein